MALGTQGSRLSPDEAQHIADKATPTLERVFFNMPHTEESLIGKPAEVEEERDMAGELRDRFAVDRIVDITGMCPNNARQETRRSHVPFIIDRTKAEVGQKLFIINKKRHPQREIITIQEDPLVYLSNLPALPGKSLVLMPEFPVPSAPEIIIKRIEEDHEITTGKDKKEVRAILEAYRAHRSTEDTTSLQEIDGVMAIELQLLPGDSVDHLCERVKCYVRRIIQGEHGLNRPDTRLLSARKPTSAISMGALDNYVDAVAHEIARLLEPGSKVMKIATTDHRKRYSSGGITNINLINAGFEPEPGENQIPHSAALFYSRKS